MNGTQKTTGWFSTLNAGIGSLIGLANSAGTAYGNISDRRNKAIIDRINAKGAIDAARSAQIAERIRRNNIQAAANAPKFSPVSIVTDNKGKWLAIAALVGVFVVMRQRSA